MKEYLLRELIPAVIGVLVRGQIVEWYDELDRLTGNPVARLNRAVAVGAYLREQAGDLACAVRLAGDVARAATNLAERDHLTRKAARLNDALRR